MIESSSRFSFSLISYCSGAGDWSDSRLTSNVILVIKIVFEFTTPELALSIAR
jgi:hypothetical protein